MYRCLAPIATPLLALLLLAGLAAGAPSEPGTEVLVETGAEPEVIQTTRTATALVLAVDAAPDNKLTGLAVTIEGQKHRLLSQQTGVAIGADGFILTAAHGIQDSSRLVVFAHDGQKWRRFSTQWVKRNTAMDLALIKLDTADLRLRDTRIRPRTLRVSEEIFFWAYLRLGRIFRPFYRKAVVSALAQGKGPGNTALKVIFFEAISVGGSSGSPLFNADGDLVGVVSGQLERFLTIGKERSTTRQPVGLSYGVAGDTIIEFLDSAGFKAQ
jgi:S1-C subfamily serine protease